eukprot:5976037-Amphidinium_carterae.1
MRVQWQSHRCACICVWAVLCIVWVVLARQVPRVAALAAGSSGSIATSASKMSIAADPILPASPNRHAEVIVFCALVFMCMSVLRDSEVPRMRAADPISPSSPEQASAR